MYQQPQEYLEQPFLAQDQQYPPQTQILKQQFIAQPQSALSSSVSFDSLIPSDLMPVIQPPYQSSYSVFTDSYFLDDLEPPGVDSEKWHEESMSFIERSGRYQRPETTVDAGTGWMGDIQWLNSDYVETRLVDALQEFGSCEALEISN